MTPVALRIVPDVSFGLRINHQSRVSWLGQYLVKLEGDSCCSAHCTGRFICEGINHEIIILSWQAHYLGKLDDDS